MSGVRPLAFAALGLAGLGVVIVAEPAPRVIWNASASAPLGLYWVARVPIERGDFVIAEPPNSVRQLAAARGYLPLRVRLVKRVAALAGDVICASGSAIRINGRLAAERLDHDGRGRPLPGWQGCRRLGPHDAFLLTAEVPDSFDGRYFGPVSDTAIVGKALPLWTFWPEHGRGTRDSRIKGVPSESADGFVCTSIFVTAPVGGCRHLPDKSLFFLRMKPVSVGRGLMDESRGLAFSGGAAP